MYDPFEYFVARHKDGLMKTDFAKPLGRVSYHVPCHLRVQNMGRKTEEFLKLIPGTTVTTVDLTAPFIYYVNPTLPSLLAQSSWTVDCTDDINMCPSLIDGATGTGKTVSLITLAEGFSRLGVPVFVADVKGDIAGLAMPGAADERIRQRVA